MSNQINMLPQGYPMPVAFLLKQHDAGGFPQRAAAWGRRAAEQIIRIYVAELVTDL